MRERERERERRLSAAATQTPRARALTHPGMHTCTRSRKRPPSRIQEENAPVNTGRCRQTRARQSAQSCRSARACVHMHVQGNGLFISEAKQKNRVT